MTVTNFAIQITWMQTARGDPEGKVQVPSEDRDRHTRLHLEVIDVTLHFVNEQV
jgi:hypothetical protein